MLGARRSIFGAWFSPLPGRIPASFSFPHAPLHKTFPLHGARRPRTPQKPRHSRTLARSRSLAMKSNSMHAVMNGSDCLFYRTSTAQTGTCSRMLSRSRHATQRTSSSTWKAATGSRTSTPQRRSSAGWRLPSASCRSAAPPRRCQRRSTTRSRSTCSSLTTRRNSRWSTRWAPWCRLHAAHAQLTWVAPTLQETKAHIHKMFNQYKNVG